MFKAAANERYSKFWSELSSETEHESDHEEEHHDDEDHHDHHQKTSFFKQIIFTHRFYLRFLFFYVSSHKNLFIHFI